MKDHERNAFAAILADADQYSAQYRDWLHSLTRDQLWSVRDTAKHLADLAEETKSGPLAAMVQITMHSLVMEFQRRVEIDAGGVG